MDVFAPGIEPGTLMKRTVFMTAMPPLHLTNQGSTTNHVLHVFSLHPNLVTPLKRESMPCSVESNETVNLIKYKLTKG